MTTKLDEWQLWLKGDYQLGIKETSRVADMCFTHALSDPSMPQYRSHTCTTGDKKHTHFQRCPRCEIGTSVQNDIRSTIESLRSDAATTEIQKNLLEDLVETVTDAETTIFDYKKHVVRSTFSNLQRKIIIEKLWPYQALITLDFAQKLLPQRHSESQRDYFGKRGIVWHISHVLFHDGEELVQHSYVHILGYHEQVKNNFPYFATSKNIFFRILLRLHK